MKFAPKKQIRNQKTAKKYKKNIMLCVAVVAFLSVFYGLAIYNTPSSDAAVKATDFKAGNIIDDATFFNKDSMTVAEIQKVLDNNIPSCDTWGAGYVGSRTYPDGTKTTSTTTRAQYAAKMLAQGKTNYHTPPYVCLNNYYENPTTHETLYDTNNEIKEGMISSAQIIFNVAQEFGINPQVLITMLKKESYVWGDNWPLKNEYNTVMGYACPDGAACDSKYYGFYNQVYMAAWQFNYYNEHLSSYRYQPNKNNKIYYSPTSSCGYKTVYIENKATAFLYIYTPYTPNDAALSAYPGTAKCGSYGNRNFFMYFSEMFGSTHNTIVKTVKENDLSDNETDSTSDNGKGESNNASSSSGDATVEQAKIDISTLDFSTVGTYVFTGNAIEPTVVIGGNGVDLVRGTDYDISYSSNINVGIAAITINGKGKYTGSKVLNFTIKAATNISYGSVSKQQYTGKQIKPLPTVKYGSIVLKNGTDYVLSYGANTKIGRGWVKVTLKGNYSGSKVIYFNIKLGQAKISKTLSTSGKIVATWGAITGASGYQFAYRRVGATAWNYSSTKSLSRTISGLNRGSSYQVTVRAYRIQNGGTYYGPWSSRIVVKVK